MYINGQMGACRCGWMYPTTCVRLLKCTLVSPVIPQTQKITWLGTGPNKLGRPCSFPLPLRISYPSFYFCSFPIKNCLVWELHKKNTSALNLCSRTKEDTIPHMAHHCFGPSEYHIVESDYYHNAVSNNMYLTSCTDCVDCWEYHVWPLFSVHLYVTLFFN